MTPPKSGPDPFLALLEMLIAEAGSVRKLAEKSGAVGRTLEDWRAGSYPKRRASKALRDVDNWATRNVPTYPRRGSGKTLLELAAAPATPDPLPAAQAPDPPGIPTIDYADTPADTEDDKGSKRVDEAPPEPPSTNRRIIALVAAVSGVVIALAITGALLTRTPEVTIQGTVLCNSGAFVQGIWLETSNHVGSSMARFGPVDQSGTDFTWSGPLDDEYSVHVGCGGSPEVWKIIGYSDFTSSNFTRFVCDDSAPEANQPPHHTRCRDQPAESLEPDSSWSR